MRKCESAEMTEFISRAGCNKITIMLVDLIGIKFAVICDRK